MYIKFLCDWSTWTIGSIAAIPEDLDEGTANGLIEGHVVERCAAPEPAEPVTSTEPTE